VQSERTNLPPPKASYPKAGAIPKHVRRLIQATPTEMLNFLAIDIEGLPVRGPAAGLLATKISQFPRAVVSKW
jgi:hypothetical protein